MLLRRILLLEEIVRLMSKATAALALFLSKSINVLEASMDVREPGQYFEDGGERSMSEIKYFR